VTRGSTFATELRRRVTEPAEPAYVNGAALVAMASLLPERTSLEQRRREAARGHKRGWRRQPARQCRGMELKKEGRPHLESMEFAMQGRALASSRLRRLVAVISPAVSSTCIQFIPPTRHWTSLPHTNRQGDYSLASCRFSQSVANSWIGSKNPLVTRIPPLVITFQGL